MKRLFVKCVDNSFAAELNVGHYYLATSIEGINEGCFIVNSIKDNSGWPIWFPAYHFRII